MRILLTNARLDYRAGAEWTVRQHARALQARGHSVVAFSSDPMRRPRLLESDLVPVATDLRRLTLAPDLVHARHHLDAMTAISALTDAPMVFQCPPRPDAPVPVHPRIYAYLVRSQTEADALHKIVQPAEVLVWRQPLDLERFGPAREPGAVLRRALFLNRRRPGDEALVAALHASLARRSIALEFVSPLFDRAVDGSGDVFLPYDVVFTAGGAAAEAVAHGCAVVVTDRGQVGEMVLPENLSRLAAMDFRIPRSAAGAALDREIDLQLARYSAGACAAVTERLRGEVDRDAFDALAGLYGRVRDRHRTSSWNPAAEFAAVSRYLAATASAITAINHELLGQWARPNRDHTFYDLRARLGLLQERRPPP